MIKAKLVGDSISSVSEEAFVYQDRSCFGEKSKNKIEYALVEALFLVLENKMEVFSGSKKLSEEALTKKLKKIDKKIETKLAAYRDLRIRGYIVKTALKFGADFRVYEKGVRPGEEHAKWILFVTKEHEFLNWHDFAAKNRVAHSAKKNLLIAIIDEEGDASYYEVAWIRP